MNKFNLPQGLLDSVTNVLKTTPRDNTPLQEKLIKSNQDAVKSATDFDNAVSSIVAEGRKKEAERQAKFAESAAKAHKGMGKSIVESIATKEEVVKEQFILDESAFVEIATRMKNVGTARRMQNMTEQKETIKQMTRTFAATFDQIVEANVSAELRSDEAIQEALQSVKADIRTQMLHAVNVASAARVVDEAAKIMSFISVQEALKGKQHKIDANKNGKIDAHDFEVLKARKARGQGEAVDEAEKPRSAGSVFDKDVAKSFSKKKPGELTGHESKKTSTGMVYTKKLDKEKEETNEGVLATVKKYAAKAGKALVGKNDDELLADLHKDVHGTKPTTVDVEKFKKNTAMDVGSLKKRLAKEEVEQVAEVSTKMIGRAVNAAGKKAFKAGEAGDNAGEQNALDQQARLVARGAAKKRPGGAAASLNAEEVNMDTPGNSYKHQCAIHVKHSKLGEGKTLYSQHAQPDAEGNIEWYDVMFSEGIERVMTADLEILVSESHMNHDKKKK